MIEPQQEQDYATLSVLNGLCKNLTPGIPVEQLQAKKCYVLKTESGEYVIDVIKEIHHEDDLRWVDCLRCITTPKLFASEVVAGPFDDVVGFL